MSNFNAYTFLNDIAAAMFSAINNDLSPIRYRAFTPTQKTKGAFPQEAPLEIRRPNQRDIEDIIVFSQTWGSSSLGFEGIGCASMTTAPTIIIRCRSEYAVYFGDKFAYLIKNANRTFFEDLKNKNMCKVSLALAKYNI